MALSEVVIGKFISNEDMLVLPEGLGRRLRETDGIGIDDEKRIVGAWTFEVIKGLSLAHAAEGLGRLTVSRFPDSKDSLPDSEIGKYYQDMREGLEAFHDVPATDAQQAVYLLKKAVGLSPAKG